MIAFPHILIFLIQCMFHIAEACRDNLVISGQRPDAKKADRGWHYWNAMIALIVHATIARISGDWMLIATGLIARLLILQVALNYLRGKSIFHLGDGTIDRVFKKMGPITALCVKLILFAGSIIYCCYA